jgi:hypothetical protein
MDARKAHHAFRAPEGDFVSYLKMFDAYKKTQNTESFCKRYYLDEKTMAEIANIKEQLTEMTSDLGVPISGGGPVKHFLICIAKGSIQFVCRKTRKEGYKSLTAESIQIHPGSVMFRESPEYIVAGEIVKTSRMFARSVSPLSKEWLKDISPVLFDKLMHAERHAEKEAAAGRPEGGKQLQIGSLSFPVKPFKGKKSLVTMAWEDVNKLVQSREKLKLPKGYRGRLVYKGMEILASEKLETVFKIAAFIDPDKDLSAPQLKDRSWSSSKNLSELTAVLDRLLTLGRGKKKAPGFAGLHTDGKGRYWIKITGSFYSALMQSISSLEVLIDEMSQTSGSPEAEKINTVYRKLSDFFS